MHVSTTRVVTVIAVAIASLVGFASGASAQFNGTPATPQPFVSHPDYLNFDVQIHSQSQWDELAPMEAEHGSSCGGPPQTHAIGGAYEDAVFICNNHVMTALNANYGVIYLTPARLLDCTGPCTVQFEMSTHKFSGRDWPDVYVTPYEDNLALPLISQLSEGVDLQGPPLNGVHVGLDNSQNAPQITTVINGAAQLHNVGAGTPSINSGIVAGTNESATRQTFLLTMTPGHVRFERLASASAPALVFFDRDVSNFKRTNSMIVQFGHHSYNPSKDCSGPCGPNTWHWDNFTLTPSVPFTMIHADRRLVKGSGSVGFAAAAPANAYLRFSAICAPLVDGVVAPRTVFSGKPEHFSSYFVPIAAGKQSVNITFRGDGFYSSPCMAKDFTIWSKQGGPAMTAPAAPSNLRIVKGND